MSKWNEKRFSVYTSEEKSALGLINELGEQTNNNTDEIEKVKISDNKKVSHQEMPDTYKIDKNANFTGSWFGIKKPTASQEGLQGTVNKIVEEDIPNINSQMDTIKSNHVIYNDRELKDGNNYALDVANFVGQGLYPTGSNENNKYRCAVFHNYVDTEVLTIDNVGEMSSIFVRNARNSERRIDKESNFIPKSNYLDFRQGFMNEDGTSHSFVQMFKMNYLGDMYFPNNRNDVVTHKIYTISEILANKDYAFQIGSYYNTRYIARFDYENNKSALNISLDTTKANTQLISPSMGLKLTANKGNAYLEALNGNVVLKGNNGAYVYKDGANLPIISMVSKKTETSTSNGTKGDCFVNSTHLYICYETNKWIRIAKDSSW